MFFGMKNRQNRNRFKVNTFFSLAITFPLRIFDCVCMPPPFSKTLGIQLTKANMFLRTSKDKTIKDVYKFFYSTCRKIIQYNKLSLQVFKMCMIS